MEYYDLALNDLNLIIHLGKSRETFIRFTYDKNIQEKVEVGRLYFFMEYGKKSIFGLFSFIDNIFF